MARLGCPFHLHACSGIGKETAAALARRGAKGVSRGGCAKHRGRGREGGKGSAVPGTSQVARQHWAYAIWSHPIAGCTNRLGC